MASSNVWLGCSAINFSNVQEAGALQVTAVDDYLSSIQYVVDVSAKKEDLSAMLSSVGVAYARDGTVDFGTKLGDGTTTAANAYTIQVTEGYSFDLDLGTEMIGRMPCKLRGNYASHVNAGADDIVLTNGSFPLVESSNLDLSSIQTLTVDPSIADSNGDVIVPMSDVGGGSEFGTTNVAMAAIPKAISAQMEGFASDENLLRLVANASSYFNLLTFPLSGSVDQSDNVVRLHTILKGKSGIADAKVNEVAALLQDMGDETADVQQREIGHHIVASILNANPPSKANTSDFTPGGSDLWKIVDDDAAGPYDTLQLDNTSGLSNVILQYVLKTTMTLKSRSGVALNNTLSSPLTDPDNQEVQILYNIRFDR